MLDVALHNNGLSKGNSERRGRSIFYDGASEAVDPHNVCCTTESENGMPSFLFLCRS